MACDHEENASIATEKVRAAGWVVKDPYRIGACTVRTEVSADETRAAEKLAIVQSAMGRVHGATGISLAELRLYLAPNVRCVAFMGENANERSYSMFLGDKTFQKSEKQVTAKVSGMTGGQGVGVRGVADQLYDANRKSKMNPARWVMSKADYQNAKANAKAEAVVVHELGHILHESQYSNEFWTIKKNRGAGGGMGHEFQDPNVKVKPMNAPAALANQVSQYAGTGIIEFIAEVFTGLVYGKRYSRGVMDLYFAEGGPGMIQVPRP